MTELIFGVSDFVAVFNQTLEIAYPLVTIVGEVTNFRVSKNRWVYFDLKDESASVKFFGNISVLPGPLEDGMLLKVRGMPRLHPLYGFNINILNIKLEGEGTLKRAAQLLQAKLTAEGLFDEERKRPLPYPPSNIGLITSQGSAAYHDFIKILGERWGGIEISLIDVTVQGETAATQIVAALDYLNTSGTPVEVVVITRGGGSIEDLAVFNSEQVTRAVAASRIPTLVAIGHEIDISLAELAADQRASTPSNAAELLVPDKKQILNQIKNSRSELLRLLDSQITGLRVELIKKASILQEVWGNLIGAEKNSLNLKRQLIEVLNPNAALGRGYAIVRSVTGQLVRSTRTLKTGDNLAIQLSDGAIDAIIKKIKLN